MIRILLGILVAASVGTGCGNSSPFGTVPIEPIGSFLLTIREFGDSAIGGQARYYPTHDGGAPILTFDFLGKAPGFRISLTGNAVPASTEHWDIGEDDADLQGTVERFVGGETEYYVMTDGFATYTLLANGRLAGEFSFNAEQRDGPSPGTRVGGNGNFSATCVGECPGGGGDPGAS